MQLITEEWKYILESNNTYQISNHGNARSVDRYIDKIGKHGNSLHTLIHGRHIKTENIHVLSMQNANCPKISRYIDTLVIEYFTSYSYDDWKIIEHVDGNLCNNYVLNLRVIDPFADKDEIWKYISGWEPLYMISTKGRILKCPNKTLSSKGVTHTQRCMFMAQTPDVDGYLRCSLAINGKSANYGVHRLVADVFIPNTENKPQVNHIDGNKQNNCVDNLEWCTCQENMDHAKDIGLRPHSIYEDRTTVKKSLSHSVRCIETGQEFYSMIEAERQLGLRSGAVYDNIHFGTSNRLKVNFIRIPYIN